MADSEDTLFLRWQDIETDAAFVRAAIFELGHQCEFADLSLSDQQLALALALMKKRAWLSHLVGRC